jgi:hypothetical protein
MSTGQIVFALSLVLPGVLGFLIGRWWFLLAIAGIWLGLAVYLWENDGWYGHGWGDFGEVLTFAWALLTLLCGAIGVGVRRASSRVACLEAEAGP